jgi:hypothetical protein
MELCYIRDATEDEMGRYTLVLNGLSLHPGWCDLQEITRFCTQVLGASTWAYDGDKHIVVRYENMKKYRVPNTFNIDDLIKTLKT